MDGWGEERVQVEERKMDEWREGSKTGERKI